MWQFFLFYFYQVVFPPFTLFSKEAFKLNPTCPKTDKERVPVIIKKKKNRSTYTCTVKSAYANHYSLTNDLVPVGFLFKF